MKPIKILLISIRLYPRTEAAPKFFHTYFVLTLKKTNEWNSCPCFVINTTISNKIRLHQPKIKSLWIYLSCLPEQNGGCFLHTYQFFNADHCKNKINKFFEEYHNCIRMHFRTAQVLRIYTHSLLERSNWC